MKKTHAAGHDHLQCHMTRGQERTNGGHFLRDCSFAGNMIDAF